MYLSEFDYNLPQELIAQVPPGQRDSARMLVLDRIRGSFSDMVFSSLPSLVDENDLIVLNNTRVVPARLQGRRTPSGGFVELLLLRRAGPRDENVWEVMGRPARKLQHGTLISFPGTMLTGEVLDRIDATRVTVRFNGSSTEADLETVGKTPLPPYIRRTRDQPDAEDRERYQTVYASAPGAIAAPTAGLHFTSSTLDEIRARGTSIAEITLHTGYGTFEPVRARNLEQHSVASERFKVSDESADRINGHRSRNGRIIAIGTTTVRALESAVDEKGRIEAGERETGLTIIPGYEFRVAGALLTNFHLPRSSLLILVSAFAGRDLVMRAYRHAVTARYRFYSYGDCMFIL